MGTNQSNTGDVYWAMGECKEALQQYWCALRIRLPHLGPRDPKVMRLMELSAALEMNWTMDGPRNSAHEEFIDGDREDGVSSSKQGGSLFLQECRMLHNELEQVLGQGRQRLL